jgi:hypothetical protein
MDAKEAPCQHATVDELAELPFHEAGDVTVTFTLTGQERFQMPGDD